MTTGKQPGTLIVGQGLAGTLLAWQLIRIGKPFLVVDSEESVTSSKIAGGIITPITGMRMVKTWRLDGFFPAALEFYRWAEIETGSTLFLGKPIQRLCKNLEERQQFARRMKEPGFADYVIEEGVANTKDLLADDGGFVMRGGYLDVAHFLQVSRQRFAEQNSYCCGQVNTESLEIRPSCVHWNGNDFSQVVFCEGWTGRNNPYFDWIPFKPAKGEVLDIHCDALDENHIINRNGFLAPLGDSRFRAGSTYEWDQLDMRPTDSGKNEISKKIRGMTRLPFEVIDHKAGVRPIISGSKALLGRHPGEERLAYFNGLGSKGVLNGPFLSAMLARHLVDGTEIDECVDLRKNI